MTGEDLEVLLRDLYNRMVDDLWTRQIDPDAILAMYERIEELAGDLMYEEGEIAKEELEGLASRIRDLISGERPESLDLMAASDYALTAADALAKRL